MRIRENLSLIIGIAIPILMILFIGGSIYLPGIFVKPEHDFLYSIRGEGSSYYYDYGWQPFIVENRRLIRNPQPRPLPPNYGNAATPPPPPPEPELKLYRHDIQKNESEQVTFDEVSGLTIDPNQISPDGFEVVNYYGGGDFFFLPFILGGGGERGIYLKGHNIAKELNLEGERSYYYNFKFLGWIEE